MAGAVAVRENNLQDWKLDEWEDEMVAELDNHRYFRWFDSGDCYTLALAEKLLRVMRRTPWVKHWFPTRMGKFAKFSDVLTLMQELPNVMVRHSADDLDQAAPQAVGSVVVTSEQSAADLGAMMCGAPKNDGKCGDCRACWSKDVPVVAYHTHGQSMKKVIRLKSA